MENTLVNLSPRRNTTKATIDWDGDFSAYMEAKNNKLRVQFQKEFERKESCSVFVGVTIWVDGDTSPTREELRELVGLGGGKFETYFSRHLVTHIVAENLSASKTKEWKRYRLHSIAVVKPQWVVDSFVNKKLQPVAKYLTPGIFDDHQKQLDILRTECPIGPMETKSFVQDTKTDNPVKPSAPRSTSENPNFVRDFFAQSRLHFIGSFRARYEKILARLVAEEGTLCKLPYDRTKTSERIIFHVDMDCFFAAVAIAKNPSLKNRPIAVCHARQHSDMLDSSCEISSANYEARAFGVHAGMFVGEARKLAPELITVPYDFEAYEKTSELVYRIFLEYSEKVEAVSVDEAYLEMTSIVLPLRIRDKEICSIEDLALELRMQIEKVSGCTASIGIGSNKTLARIATKRAKPNGQFTIWSHEAMEKLSFLPVEQLPGVGWMTRRRMHSMNIFTCQQLRQLSLEKLEMEFGKQTALSLFDACRGKDDRPLELYRPPKSVGAEVNWGVRFENNSQGAEKCKKFILDIVNVVCERLKATDAKATKLTYKVLRKQNNAPPPRKYLGCGLVDEFSKSTNLPCSNSALELGPRCLTLHESLNIPLDELRGVGIHCFGLVFSTNLQQRNSNTTLSKYFQMEKNPQQLRIDNCLKMSRSSPRQQDTKVSCHEKITKTPQIFSSCGGFQNELDEYITKKGWSHQVFHQLPKELQMELVKNSPPGNVCHKNYWKTSSPVLSRKRPRGKRDKTKSTLLQPTLTQLDDIYQAQVQGLSQIMDAEELQNRSIRDCLEILQDIEHAKKSNIPSCLKDSKNSVDQEQVTWCHHLRYWKKDPFIELSKYLSLWIKQIQSLEPELRQQHQEALVSSIYHEIENKNLYQVQGFMRILGSIAREYEDTWITNMANEIQENIQRAMHKYYNGAIFKRDLRSPLSDSSYRQ